MTKRCKNCGWLNDDSSQNCQKCNAQLDGGMVSNSRPQPVQANSENLRRTVSENQLFISEQSQRKDLSVETIKCPSCDYPIREGMDVCPNCGTSLSPSRIGNGRKCWNCGEQNPSNARYCCRCGSDLEGKQEIKPVPETSVSKAHLGTVNPWMKPEKGSFCTLRPIAWDGENVTYQPLSFSGNSIVLNRANTDPNNQSITSTEQAVLEFIDGDWYILDKSTLRTTYVQAAQKTKLHKGDTIVLGNRLFEFN